MSVTTALGCVLALILVLTWVIEASERRKDRAGVVRLLESAVNTLQHHIRSVDGILSAKIREANERMDHIEVSALARRQDPDLVDVRRVMVALVEYLGVEFGIEPEAPAPARLVAKKAKKS